jgi:Phosphate-selective porin O and P
MFNTLLRRSLLSVPVCALMLALAPAPASAQLQIKNEDVTIKFGIQGQFWADWLQDATAPSAGSQGYQQNFYLRRARLMMGGNIGSNISFFFQTDDPKLGITPKNLSSGFVLQDAWIAYQPSKYIQITGGEMLIPNSRQGLQSTLSFYSADISGVSTVNNSVEQQSALRDMGFQARGYFFDDRLQYRGGVFEGERDANGRNSLRPALYLQYDFFDREKEYAYAGTALGKRKLLAVDVGGDKQSSYRSLSANIASDTPVNGGDEVGFNLNYFHFDGRQKFTALPDQNNFMGEAAYYIHKAKVQPFVRWETQRFVAAVNNTKDINRVGGGFNYYIRGQNLKWTFQMLRAQPQNGSLIRPSNEFTLQMQVFYF